MTVASSEAPGDLADRLADEDGVVRRDGDLDAFGQRLAQLVHGGADAIRDGDGVRLGLADDFDADGGLAIEARHGGRFLEGPADERDVADLRLRVELERADVGGRCNRGLGAHQQLLRRVLERARRRVDGGLSDGRDHVAEAQAACRECNLRNADLDRLGAQAIGVRRGDALHGRQPVLDDVIDEIGKLAFGQLVGRDGHADDRRGIGVGLQDLRLVFHVLGKLAGDAGDGIAHVHGGGLKIGAAGKLDRDAARAIGRRGGDAGDALHARDGAFDDGGDLGVDAFGRGAGVTGAHRHDGAVDVRQLADLDRLQRRDAGNDDEKVQHRGQDRAANEDAHPSAVILVRSGAWQFRLGGHGGALV